MAVKSSFSQDVSDITITKLPLRLGVEKENQFLIACVVRRGTLARTMGLSHEKHHTGVSTGKKKTTGIM